jgi:hypothetical protein
MGPEDAICRSAQHGSRLCHPLPSDWGPPKIIRIEKCDVPSAAIEKLIRREAIRVHHFLISEALC